MKVFVLSRVLLNPIALPGMGKSIDLPEMAPQENQEMRMAFSQGELYVEFDDEPGVTHKVINLWANPHSSQATLFIR
ncbi:hypothetical protein [Alicyclobacillus ferrooxydans]|uniref:Uncharacterized protein n=1 Tax=Alicyclobacillus ferrooxydans TaxID=471514 RepID=A0A0P9CHV3_9BACL|nr:hypothetical protein [Alicyclobacillus ferrooxydans]KPV42624.1 hypothetical protein AN477_16770 [Alicyclobacillus ferrooxydans]